jgi:DUF4097 and DUF4098 domain-containing protein YvlB
MNSGKERFPPFDMTTPSHHRNPILTAIAVLAAASLAGCISGPSAEGTFDRTYKVNGPVQLELTTGSGDVRISPGSANEVAIHGKIEAHGWSEGDARDRIDQIVANPPISQENNLIRVGGISRQGTNVSIDYTIEVPAATELHCTTGSGDVDVKGIQGPANFLSGSGDLSAAGIGNDVQAQAGSGDINFSNIQGQLQVNTGSGDIEVGGVQRAARLHTGSGDIVVKQPNDNLVAETGSGSVTVEGAHADLRVHTGSGEIAIDGNPGPTNYWDFRASSGDVTLRVPSDASFRLYAHSSSGDIDASVPIVMEGTTAKHELRARLGDGKARVEIETSSGKITLH